MQPATCCLPATWNKKELVYKEKPALKYSTNAGNYIHFKFIL